MGNLQCNQCTEVKDLHLDTIKIPRDNTPIVSQIHSSREAEEPIHHDPETVKQSRIVYTKSSISRILPKIKRYTEYQILNKDLKAEKMSIDLKDRKKTLKDFKDKKDRFIIYWMEIGEEASGIVNVTFIDETQSNLTSAIAFAGVSKGGKKERGVYCLFKHNEAFMFQGVFGETTNTGLKVALNEEGALQKHWGSFSSTFDPEGQGKSQTFIKNADNTYEEHYFQGNFSKGLKQGQGVLRVKQKISKNPMSTPNQKLISLKTINQINTLLKTSKGEYEELRNKLIKLIINLSGYNPSLPLVATDKDYKLIITSKWESNNIEGIAEEIWPKINYRFQGIYKKNQRNGYGEEYAYDQLIAKGFYKEGVMQTDKNNGFLLMGCKLVNDQWKRSKDENV